MIWSRRCHRTAGFAYTIPDVAGTAHRVPAVEVYQLSADRIEEIRVYFADTEHLNKRLSVGK